MPNEFCTSKLRIVNRVDVKEGYLATNVQYLEVLQQRWLVEGVPTWRDVPHEIEQEQSQVCEDYKLLYRHRERQEEIDALRGMIRHINEEHRDPEVARLYFQNQGMGGALLHRLVFKLEQEQKGS